MEEGAEGEAVIERLTPRRDVDAIVAHGARLDPSEQFLLARSILLDLVAQDERPGEAEDERSVGINEVLGANVDQPEALVFEAAQEDILVLKLLEARGRLSMVLFDKRARELLIEHDWVDSGRDILDEVFNFDCTWLEHRVPPAREGLELLGGVLLPQIGNLGVDERVLGLCKGGARAGWRVGGLLSSREERHCVWDGGR
mmetsp:Transcript_27515/g.75147  ORF Transcript_27515/g.75147 Transcript_27515/m.75147 type:complete len:200 (+) Transcript_27515:3871-4470(+)|eukprot:scaffold193252_cov18-Tisochrysis_lutea.AAC.2